MATITVYDARGSGINTTRTGSSDNSPTNFSILYTEDYGNGYGAAYAEVYGEPEIDQMSIYFRSVNDVAYAKKYSFFHYGALVLKIDGI